MLKTNQFSICGRLRICGEQRHCKRQIVGLKKTKKMKVGIFLEEWLGKTGRPAAAARPRPGTIEPPPPDNWENRQSAADRALVQAGITFNVYGESAGIEKTLPFDLVP